VESPPDQETTPPSVGVPSAPADLFQSVFGGRPDTVDITRMAQLIAGWESARYFLRHMQGCRVFRAVRPLYAHALGLRSVEGLTLEFGVASGRTITQIARATPGTVYGFDSFQGLPERWRPGFETGAFAQAAPPRVPENVELVIGWFSETLPGFIARHPGPVSFLHIDCDLYSSTAEILRHVGPRLTRGSVVVFNEYFNFPGWQQHERKAWKECVAELGIEYEYCAVNVVDQQVSLIVGKNPGYRGF
jgi:hypothetical protein